MNRLLNRQATAGRRVDAVTVAMVGAGQLARMTHQAAISLGINLRVLATDVTDPAVAAGADYVLGCPDDLTALHLLAEGAEVVTFDHELIPQAHLLELSRHDVRLAPSAVALGCGQDKLTGRRTLAANGLPVPPFIVAHQLDDADKFAVQWGWPLIAKAPRGGYDGKGVWTIPNIAAAERLMAHVDGALLIEPKLAFERELAVLVARTATGDIRTYPVVETIQQNAVCREILATAPVTAVVAAAADDLARRAAVAVDAVGICAVEFFLTGDGLVINELALRPHNSGHYSMEGAITSQFEQHLRAVLGWPLGATTLTAPAVATANILGPADGSDPAQRLPQALAIPGAHIHLYAKTARPGRKLGHVTACGPNLPAARAAVRDTLTLLGIEAP